MVKALLAGFGFFVFFAAVARQAPWLCAFYLTMPFDSYDPDAIHARVKHRVFTKTWLVSALIGSSLVAAAMTTTRDLTGLLLIAAGVLIPIVVSWVQAYRLFHVAVAEFGMTWPPLPEGGA